MRGGALLAFGALFATLAPSLRAHADPGEEIVLSPVCADIQSPTCGPCFDNPSSPACTSYATPADPGMQDAGVARGRRGRR